MDASVTRNPKLRTACDRCYELKERCQRATTSAQCARCERLGLTCKKVRPVRPVGRRTHHEKDSISRIASSKLRKSKEHQPSMREYLNNLLDWKPEEKELMVSFLSEPESQDHWVVCSSFRAEQQHLLAAQLSAASSSLKYAYLSCALALKQLRSGSVTEKDTSICIAYISKAMIALRSLPVLCPQDTILCHTLGSLLAFSIYSAIGVGVPEICHYCLNTTDPFVEIMSEAHKDPWHSFLVILETMDCIVHRRRPTQTIQTPTFVIDRHLGLCLPLLPYYHDLCVISNSLLSTTDVGILARLTKQLDGIHTAVESWQPSHLDRLVGQFESAEIVNLLAQAKVYRLAALLVGHRLRFPFGCEDSQAEIWSKEAMMELEMAKHVTKRPLRFVTLPFIVAAVEVQDESQRFETLQRVHEYVDTYAPFMQKATKTFLSRVWQERDLDITNRWFDSIHKPCPVMESIDATPFTSFCN